MTENMSLLTKDMNEKLVIIDN